MSKKDHLNNGDQPRERCDPGNLSIHSLGARDEFEKFGIGIQDFVPLRSRD